MRRKGKDDDFRSNIHRGGTAEVIELEDDVKRICIDACKALDLRFAGVDLLESKRGPLIIEVNSSPGLEGIEATTGVDVAGAVIEDLEQLCS
jgi:ribosomal protein S6--L-glutamate ligase